MDEQRRGPTEGDATVWYNRNLSCAGCLGIGFALVVLLIVVINLNYSSHHRMMRRASCLSQVRQVGLAMRMYADQYGGYFPTDRPAAFRVHPYARLHIILTDNYLDDARVLKCPSDEYATGDPFDSDNPSVRLTRRNCSYSVNMLPELVQQGDPRTALAADEPEFDGVNSVNHGRKRGEGPGLGEGQNVFRIGGDAKFFLTPANDPDPNIFRINPDAKNDAYLPDTGP